MWQECWTADPYGSRWMPLTSALGYSIFICTKKITSESELFIFKPDKSIQDGRKTASWMVKNLHSSRMKEFWEKANSLNQQPDSLKQEPNSEKWSHEAIVARSNVRPLRMQKLKVAGNSGQHPGFDFLHECWDDPALQIVIKKLLAKFPQWGVAIVDGVLVDWNE
ncbi:hypothetical protein [Komarekiella delphini-convector]|uniref:hypothetical protein n=1 Tax=Komarekiella delphini-convector TaxID=3050158 RepID=UPI001CD878D8|nr:hypothetical protein [Komarekiella delphini-convector]